MIASRRWFGRLNLSDVAKACSRGFAGAGNDVAIGIARIMLYCETVFVIIEYPAEPADCQTAVRATRDIRK
jgi:hypothetical protein